MNNYQGVNLTDDQLNGARIRLRTRVQQAIQDMQSASYDPGTIAYLIADLEALARFDGQDAAMNGTAQDEDPVRPTRARRGH